MNPIKASYITYFGNGLRLLLPDGSESYKSFEELEYPYFYGDKDFTGEPNVIKSEPANINIMYLDKVETNVPMFKTSVSSPFYVKQYRDKCKTVSEADILYLERRLGADGIIEWTAPETIACLDIENDKNGKIFLTGVQVIRNSKAEPYISFHRPEDLIDFLENNRIKFVTAFNGDNYDFLMLYDYLKDKPHFAYFSKMMFIDILPIYGKLLHKRPAPLSQIAVQEGFEEKLEINYITNMDENHYSEVEIYNQRDVRILVSLILKYNLINSIFLLAKETGVAVFGDNFFISQIPEIENYIMKHRDTYKIWLAPKEHNDKEGKYKGAEITTPPVGIWNSVGVVDYSSLYPNSVIHTKYTRTKYPFYELLQTILKVFLKSKKLYKKKGKDTGIEEYKLLSDVFKILANGSYGVIGSPYFRYFNADAAEFITETGKAKRQELQRIIETEYDIKVLYGDTDSAFCLVKSEEDANILVEALNKEIAPFEVALDKYFVRMVFFLGSNQQEVKKKYAGIDPNGIIKIVGLEAIRKEWTQFAKNTQKEALDIILKGDVSEIENSLNKLWEYKKVLLLSGRVDLSDLLITKSVKKNKEYKVQAPHVKAYNMLVAENGESQSLIPFVSYWILRGSKKNKNDVLPVGISNVEEGLKRLNLDYYLEHQLNNIMERMVSSVKY